MGWFKWLSVFKKCTCYNFHIILMRIFNFSIEYREKRNYIAIAIISRNDSRRRGQTNSAFRMAGLSCFRGNACYISSHWNLLCVVYLLEWSSLSSHLTSSFICNRQLWHETELYKRVFNGRKKYVDFSRCNVADSKVIVKKALNYQPSRTQWLYRNMFLTVSCRPSLFSGHLQKFTNLVPCTGWLESHTL